MLLSIVIILVNFIFLISLGRICKLIKFGGCIFYF